MKRTPRRHLLALGALAATVVACGTASKSPTVQTPAQPANYATLSHEISQSDYVVGERLYARLCASTPLANLVMSPSSLTQALGMLQAGASGSTETAIAKLLDRPDWSPALVSTLARQTQALHATGQLEVSNHVFQQDGLHPSAALRSQLSTAYAADLRNLDFAGDPDTATRHINDVVSHDTDGMIPTLFGQPLDPSTVTVLVDALLLDAKWQAPFDPESTDPAPFASPHGTVTVDTMGSGHMVAERRSAGWTSVTLPYRGGHLQAVALLPPTTAASCAIPSAHQVAALSSGASSSTNLDLPKLDLNSNFDLTQQLASLGLPLGGDYSALGGNSISEIIQQVVMKVDEEGTKAAAATGVAVATSAHAVIGPVFRFDRPFLLLLEDTGTHTPLFLAHVTDPSQ